MCLDTLHGSKIFYPKNPKQIILNEIQRRKIVENIPRNKLTYFSLELDKYYRCLVRLKKNGCVLNKTRQK